MENHRVTRSFTEEKTEFIAGLRGTPRPPWFFLLRFLRGLFLGPSVLKFLKFTMLCQPPRKKAQRPGDPGAGLDAVSSERV